MKISRNAAALGTLALLLAGAGVGVAQDAPESLLPPGFNEPVAPAPAPAPTARPTPGAPAAPITPGQPVPGDPLASGAPLPTPTPSPSPTDVAEIDLSKYELPAAARRPLDKLGAIGSASGGVPANGFATSDGPGLQRLMRRIDAPLPSRWLSISLRRALESRVAPPRGVHGADFAAERAWLLLRMGEADSARAVVQSVDVDDYTPKLFQVAMQAMLATGDPAGLCPLVQPAMRVSNEAAWRLALPICTALSGKLTEASGEFRQAQNRIGRSIDTLLAEKVLGAAAQGRAVTIEDDEWNRVDRLTIWRIGLATATAVPLPGELLKGVRPQVAAWRATAPMLSAATRVANADYAASQGVLSNLALVDLYGEIESVDEAPSNFAATARDLRSAYGEGTAAERLSVLRRLWDEPSSARGKFARLILTARAAARIPAAEDHADDASRVIAAMLTAGLDRGAVKWREFAPARSDGWAMLALADPVARRVSAGDVEGYRSADETDGAVKSRLFFAGLAGLGRLEAGEAQRLAQSFDVRIGEQNAWTRAITAAAARREAGTVLTLVAAGMQTPAWRGVPPEVLFHACAALRTVGLEGEARMIAAEAIARL